MSAPKKKPTRAEQEHAAAEQRRLAPVLREAHARLRLWRLCEDQTCRRSKSCGGEEDAVEAANFAALGYRHRFVIRWPNVPYWDDLEFFMCNDGTWKRTSTAPSRPEIDPQFFELAASPWLRDAVRADTEV
jgi:hypothetical protein